MLCDTLHHGSGQGGDVIPGLQLPSPTCSIAPTRASKLVVRLSATQVLGHATENQPWVDRILVRELFFIPWLHILCEATNTRIKGKQILPLQIMV